MAARKSITKELVDLEVPQDARLSPSAEKVVYSTKPAGKKGEHETSTLWVADVAKQHSARQLTSGSYNDRDAQWSPAGTSIAFLSDRFKQGESCAIYAMPTDFGEAHPLTKSENKQDIASFLWSPDGQYIAYLSPHEKTPEREAKIKAKDDVKVYGADWEYNRLRLLHVASQKVSVIHEEDAHVKQFAWDEASKSIVIVTQRTPDFNSPRDFGIEIKKISVEDCSCFFTYHFDGPLQSIKIVGDWIYFVATFTPTSNASALALYKLTTEGTLTRCRYGESSDAETLCCKKDLVAIKVLSGLFDEIHLVDGPLDGKVLFSGQHEIVRSSWDLVQTEEGKYVLAFVKSTASSPREVYTLDAFETLGGVEKPIQLSNHGQSLAPLNLATTKTIRCISKDEKWTLQGLYHSPACGGSDDSSEKPSKPLPTIVLIHGGPYYRWTDNFDSPFPHWQPAILNEGKYGILVPNYRGSSGRGEAFAAAARGRMGTDEFDDVLTFVDEGIRLGLVDPQRIIVGGWSQGGFLTYLCAVRNGFDRWGSPKAWSFIGGIAGAGVTDWDMICMSSDATSFEGEMAGGLPWTTKDKQDTSTRSGSAVWDMANAAGRIPPMLIIHGEEDERVPVTQAIAFNWGCLHHGVPCEMAIYPREKHSGWEQAHIVDMLGRVLKFCHARLGS